MIFGDEMADKVLAGEKTVTRRAMDSRYQVGRTYGVQPGRGKTAVAWIKAHGIGRSKLGAITDAGAREEGFRHRGDFRAYWEKLYGSWDPEEEVRVIRFRLVKTKAAS